MRHFQAELASKWRKNTGWGIHSVGLTLMFNHLTHLLSKFWHFPINPSRTRQRVEQLNSRQTQPSYPSPCTSKSPKLLPQFQTLVIITRTTHRHFRTQTWFSLIFTQVWLAKNRLMVSERRMAMDSRRSNQWWLCSLIIGLLRDVYELR